MTMTGSSRVSLLDPGPERYSKKTLKEKVGERGYGIWDMY